MLKLYKNISYLFIALLILTFLGFYRTYFGLFPSFKGLGLMAHLHATAFLLWFLLLILQPVLIKKKKYKLHRLLGKISYFLVPIIIITIVGMTRLEYYRDIKIESRQDVFSDMLTPYLDLIFFVIFYVIAMINKKNISLHVSFIIAASFVVLAPALGRLCGYLFGDSLLTILANILPKYIIVIILMIIEKRRLGKPILHSPYLLILGLFLLATILGFTIGNTTAWQWTANKIATYLF